MAAENIERMELLINELVKLYYKCFPCLDPIPCEFLLSDNLNQTHANIRPDVLLTDLEDVRNNDNGRMVVPLVMTDPFFILLNTKSINDYTNDESYTWVGTFAHELTHAHDYSQMAKMNGLENYCILEKPEYFLFSMWSEFHARRNGYSFLRYFFCTVYPEKMAYNQESATNEYEWPAHKSRFFQDYHSTTNGTAQIYYTMQLLGRYSVWCDLFPNRFGVDSLKRDFYTTPWIWHLLDFLMKHKTLEDVHDSFDEMKAVLSENWPL